MHKKSPLDMVAMILVIVGALNWGLVGVFQYNLVEHLFGGMPMVVNVVYGLVGLAAIYAIFMMKKCCHKE